MNNLMTRNNQVDRKLENIVKNMRNTKVNLKNKSKIY